MTDQREKDEAAFAWWHEQHFGFHPGVHEGFQTVIDRRVSYLAGRESARVEERGRQALYRRGAERLADAVEKQVRRERISSRSEIGDALLDFREPKP